MEKGDGSMELGGDGRVKKNALGVREYASGRERGNGERKKEGVEKMERGCVQVIEM